MMYAYDDLISDLDLFRIPEAIFKTRAFKFDSNVVVSVTNHWHEFRVLLDSWICNYSPTQRDCDLEWKGSDTNQ